MSGHVPSPREWHPAYADSVDLLLDWVEGRGQFANLHVIKWPKPQRIAAVQFDTSPITPVSFPVLTLTRRKCAGPAPYVGRPFCYVWYVGEDDAHRFIAGDARIHYIAAEAAS